MPNLAQIGKMGAHELPSNLCSILAVFIQIYKYTHPSEIWNVSIHHRLTLAYKFYSDQSTQILLMRMGT